MHNAPSVSYPVDRPRLAGLVAAALWLAGVATTLFWLVEAGPGWRQAVGGAALLLLGILASLSWWRSPRGELHWDGATWTGPAGVAIDQLEVALDVQRALLVRWQAAASAGWLWLERNRCPQRWLDLRRAVYSRARPPALPPARPPVATP